eukprot:FR736573.1.p2 GENE.FR736573.1~~FR736573.1.p2  ORF type:complete len:106 (+),score=2.13 FR736573.1:457-774(+)
MQTRWDSVHARPSIPISLLLPGICPSTTNDSPDVMASAAADPADVEADLGSGSSVRCDTGVKWTMSVSLADDEVLVMVVLAVVLPRVLRRHAIISVAFLGGFCGR